MKVVIAILLLASLAYAGIKEELIDSIISWEGEYAVLNGVVYGYGLSARYHDVNGLTEQDARIRYDSMWTASGAAKMKDSVMAMIFFDTRVLFNLDSAKVMLDRSDTHDDMIIERIMLHTKNAKRYPHLKGFYQGHVVRTLKLRKMSKKFSGVSR